MSPFLFNPLRKITQDDVEKYKGQTLAVCLKDGNILYAGNAVDVLQHQMRTLHPGVRYARITLP